MKLRGSLFKDVEVAPEPGVISLVFTEFYVDHEEPLAALQTFKNTGKWSLGELLDGHEYLIILAVWLDT